MELMNHMRKLVQIRSWSHMQICIHTEFIKYGSFLVPTRDELNGAYMYSLLLTQVLTNALVNGGKVTTSFQ